MESHIERGNSIKSLCAWCCQLKMSGFNSHFWISLSPFFME
jgi:hypothetical protein